MMPLINFYCILSAWIAQNIQFMWLYHTFSQYIRMFFSVDVAVHVQMFWFQINNKYDFNLRSAIKRLSTFGLSGRPIFRVLHFRFIFVASIQFLLSLQINCWSSVGRKKNRIISNRMEAAVFTFTFKSNIESNQWHFVFFSTRIFIHTRIRTGRYINCPFVQRINHPLEYRWIKKNKIKIEMVV